MMADDRDWALVMADVEHCDARGERGGKNPIPELEAGF